MSSDKAAFRRVNSATSRLIESYCVHCGLLIAAAPLEKTLETIEQLHRCPPHFHEVPAREQFAKLLRELSAKEAGLFEWISRSERNSRWFAADPLSAIRAAGLGIDEEILNQLELITRSIARKLRGAC